jgi:diacylglycerol O-acyltransferase / wax synthase
MLGVPVRAARRSVRVGVAIFSYDGTNFGVTGDFDTAPDSAVLCDGIERGISELVGLTGLPLPMLPPGARVRRLSA